MDRSFFEVRYVSLPKNFAENLQFSATLTHIAVFDIYAVIGLLLTQVSFPATARSWFLRSHMFRLPVVAINKELQYYKDTSSVSYVGKREIYIYIYISFL
jgi:hypothetical protein